MSFSTPQGNDNDEPALWTGFRLKAVQTPPLSERALPLLSIAGLRRSFGEVDVLSGVDAEVRPGEAVAVVGPNGSGKSTLLRCVAGTDRPSAGSIRLYGRPMRAASLLDEVGLSGAANQLPACPAGSGGGWRWRRASPGPGC